MKFPITGTVRQYAVALSIILVSTALTPTPVHADTLTLTTGEVVSGVIESIAEGQVTIRVGDQEQVYGIRNVDHIDFNTPHLADLVGDDDLAHFVGDLDAQDMVRHARELRETAAEIRSLLDEVRSEWADRDAIDADEVGEWEAVRAQFNQPLSRYQEVLGDLYFHMVAHVDEYNRLMAEADDVYVGVRGIFRVGSSLIPREASRLPLESYMPRNWYDAIFYEGYYVGYDDAYQELEPELDPDR